MALPVPPPDPDHLMRLLVQQTHDVAFLLMDPDGTVLAWLGGAESIFGFTRAEAVGRSFAFLFEPHDRELGLPAHELQVAAADSRADDDRWHLRKDGNRIWISGVTLPLRGPGGTLVGFAKVVRDRTDLKAQVDALVNRNQALLAAQEERGLFLRTLGHELRNPLAPLTAALALMRRATTVAALQPSLAVVERQLASIKRLADDLSDLTRADLGRLRLQVQELEVQPLLRELVADYAPEAQRRGCGLQLLVPEGPIRIQADPARLRQILMNLLQNALKYTPAGGTIWVKATTEAQFVMLRVEDNGVGIAPEALPQIFRLFTQENPHATEAEGGMGIGLALVADLVRLHDGVIEVRSPGKGKGSEFVVRLPLQQPQPAWAGGPAGMSLLGVGDDAPPAAR